MSRFSLVLAFLESRGSGYQTGAFSLGCFLEIKGPTRASLGPFLAFWFESELLFLFLKGLQYKRGFLLWQSTLFSGGFGVSVRMLHVFRICLV